MSPVTQYLLETLVTLVVILALGAIVIAVARRVGVTGAAGPLTLEGRLPLDARHTVYLVRVADRLLVVGAGDRGLARLGELDGKALPKSPEVPAPRSFRETLDRVLLRPAADTVTKPAPDTGPEPDTDTGPEPDTDTGPEPDTESEAPR